MNVRGPRPGAVAIGLLLAACGVTAVAAGIVALRRLPPPRAPEPPPVALELITPPAAPIAAEADVFETKASMLAIEPAFPRVRTAHPRTWATYRFIRAYPGAPPRIPHALSADEFRVEVCTSCHSRGGYSLRFAAYVPVTPHPELGMCLQCHVGDDAVMGTASAAADPNLRCPMCHGQSGGAPRPEASATWPTTVWPAPPPTTPGRLPPPIPHDLELRGNCLACHGGPAAVAAIRTKHPERVNCRQCHAEPEAGAGEYVRPSPELVASAGAVP